jgi:hypothetical protein
MFRRLVSLKIVLLVCFSPSVVAAFDLSLDYSHHRDWHTDRGAIRSNFITLRVANTPRENLEYYVYRSYGKTGDITTKDNGGFGIGYDPVINDKWSLWFDGNWSYDKALAIDSEIFLGGGPKYYIYKKGAKKLSLSAGILHQTREPGNFIDQRWSFRLKGSTDNWSGSAFYQPNVDDSSDYISRGEIEGRVNKTVSVFWNTLYRSVEDSQVTAMGLRFRFSTGGGDEKS